MHVDGIADDGSNYGVKGENTNNPPPILVGKAGPIGVLGEAPNGTGVSGTGGTGVFGTSVDPRGAGVWGESTGGGNGVYGHSNGGNAGWFDGNLHVSGNASVSGTDPSQPGILGKPANVYVPQTLAIGVKGDGGAGFPSPIPGNPVLLRRAIGVFGTSADPNG